MTKILVIGVVTLTILGGAALYITLAATAIIYSMGANKSTTRRRAFFGILGVAMIYAFICACIYLHKYGMPL